MQLWEQLEETAGNWGGGGESRQGEQLGDTIFLRYVASSVLCFENWLILRPSIFFFPMEGSGKRAKLHRWPAYLVPS